MEISIYSLLEGAARATGTVAVIDLFCTFTTAAVALVKVASRIDGPLVEERLALRDAGIGHVCMGEVRGRAPDGFDFGNSPCEISGIHFRWRDIIQRTSAGTQGIAASKAERLHAASVVTVEGTVRALR
jgi:2-phosphosulfolactate phosphatase